MATSEQTEVQAIESPVQPAPGPTEGGAVMPGPGSPADHELHWHQVALPFGMLNMTTLLESAARGEEERVSAELERITKCGEQRALDDELAATDDWAASTPLHWAAYAGSPACIDLLIDAGASHCATNLRDSSQPLHLAARYGHFAAAQALLDRHADVNAVNARGNTPLHECCAKVECAGVVETLLRARADIEVYNDPDLGERMMTPLLVASEVRCSHASQPPQCIGAAATSHIPSFYTGGLPPCDPGAAEAWRGPPCLRTGHLGQSRRQLQARIEAVHHVSALRDERVDSEVSPGRSGALALSVLEGTAHSEGVGDDIARGGRADDGGRAASAFALALGSPASNEPHRGRAAKRRECLAGRCGRGVVGHGRAGRQAPDPTGGCQRRIDRGQLAVRS